MRLTRFGIAALVTLAAAPPATACLIVSVAYQPLFWHRLIDHRAPTVPEIITREVEVHRGIGPRATDRPGVTYATSCDDIGRFSLDLLPTRDDRTGPDAMGYSFELVEGTAPEGLFDPGPLGAVPLAAQPDGDKTYRLTLSWIDGATDEQEPLAFSFTVRAVDRGGNRSAPSDTIRVEHPGFSAGANRGR